MRAVARTLTGDSGEAAASVAEAHAVEGRGRAGGSRDGECDDDDGDERACPAPAR
jgi:hypothetical protein